MSVESQVLSPPRGQSGHEREWWPMRPAARLRARPRARILIITEGTYPYAVGGVSSWCDALIGRLERFDWDILPIVAGGKRLHQNFTLPANARLLHPIELWSEALIPPRVIAIRSGARESIAATLVRGLLPWEPSLPDFRAAIVRCRHRPYDIRREFRSRQTWEEFLRVLTRVLDESHDDSAPAPVYDALDAARLYQTLYWVARTAAVPTPPCDLLHATAAGWSAIPAIVHKTLHGTPMLLTEHGVYVREAYFAALRDAEGSAADHHMSTRLALGLTRAAYAVADTIAPVTEANAEWERGLGVARARIRVIPNGIEAATTPVAPPRAARVIAMGRIDPLKDVQTMLLVAQEVTRRMPESRFEYWGPITPGQEAYAEGCARMRTQLGLGDRFRFMGRTTDPQAVIRGADLVLMTSISEAMPMSLLEAMAQGRPIVATSVGGVPDVVRGCGIVAAPGDVHGLASAIVTLLRTPSLAAELGDRGFGRLKRRYTLELCVASYRELIGSMIEAPV